MMAAAKASASKQKLKETRFDCESCSSSCESLPKTSPQTPNPRNPLQDLWLDKRTACVLKDVASAVVLTLMSQSGPMNWSMLCESILEQRFGRLRSCVSTHQLTAGDYYRCWVGTCYFFLLGLDQISKFQPPLPRGEQGGVGQTGFLDQKSVGSLNPQET